jgi:hypothetical protein
MLYKSSNMPMSRPPLGKVTMTVRVRPRTQQKLRQLAAAEQITISDYLEAVLIHHFEELAVQAEK